MKDLFKTLPIRLFLSLAVLYLLLNGLIIVLERWQISLRLQVEQSEAELSKLSQGLTRQVLGEQEYDAVVQFLSLRQLLAQRIAPVGFFEKFAALLPKNFQVDSLLINFDGLVFDLAGRVPNLLTSAQVIRYFEQQPAFREVVGTVNIQGQETHLSIKGKLNRDFFK